MSASHTHAASGLPSTPRGRAELRDKAPMRSTATLPGTHIGWVPYHGAIARACRMYLKTDTLGRVQDSDLSNLTAIFIAACYRWRGHSTKHQGGWFSKTDAQWCDELAVHKERLWDIIRFACIDDATTTALGVPNIGIIRRRTGGRHNAAAYLVDDERAGQWWLTSGPQPALQAGDNLGITVGETQGSCQPSLTTTCQPSLTHHTDDLFGGVLESTNKEKARTELSRDELERKLAEVFGVRWANALDRAVPVLPMSPAQEMTREILRQSLAATLDRGVEQYCRDEWTINDAGVLWEIGAGCSVLGLNAAWLRREVGDIVRADNAGHTMRNPTGVFVHRVRQRFANFYGVAIQAQEARQ